MYSEWEYGDDGVRIAAGISVHIPIARGDEIFKPPEVVILPTQIHWMQLCVDVAVWTVVCWLAWRLLRLGRSYFVNQSLPKS
jgi:hypothetical protein